MLFADVGQFENTQTIFLVVLGFDPAQSRLSRDRGAVGQPYFHTRRHSPERPDAIVQGTQKSNTAKAEVHDLVFFDRFSFDAVYGYPAFVLARGVNTWMPTFFKIHPLHHFSLKKDGSGTACEVVTPSSLQNRHSISKKKKCGGRATLRITDETKALHGYPDIGV
jgi:hypothetical protein